MIELGKKNVDEWKKAVEAISLFIAEGNFRFNDKGISFKAIDPSQVVLVNFNMAKSNFEKFKIEPTLIGIDIVELNRIMNRALQNDKLVMDIGDSELMVKFEGDISRSFRLPLIDVSDDEVNIPAPQFDATIEINAKILKEVLKDASLFGSSIILKVKSNKLLVEARSTSGTLDIVANHANKINVKSKADVTGKYSLNFLQNIVKEADPDKKITLELKNDAPMRVTYKIGASEIQFHLAHMIL